MIPRHEQLSQVNIIKILTLSASLCIGSFDSFAQYKIGSTEIKRQGLISAFNKSDSLWYTVTYLNDTTYGEYTIKNSTNKITLEEGMLDNRKIKYYYETHYPDTTKLILDGTYIPDRICGNKFFKDTAEMLRYDIQFSLHTGLQKTYYESGELKNLSKFALYYDREDSIHLKEMKIDSTTSYLKSGQIFRTKYYIISWDNVLTAYVIKEYYNNGAIKEIFTHSFGKSASISTSTEFYPNGSVKKIRTKGENTGKNEWYEYQVHKVKKVVEKKEEYE